MYKIFSDLMKEKGLTAYKVSKDTGISQSVLSAWKNGVSIPRPVTLKVLADYFGVSVSYLKGETEERDEKEMPAGQMADGLTKEDIDLLIQIKTAPEAKKKAILELLKGWDNE